MKNLSFLIIIIITALLIFGCVKKENTGADSGNKETSKTEVIKSIKDTVPDNNSSYHIIYILNKNGKKVTINMFQKGKKMRTETNSSKPDLLVRSTVFYSDNIIYTVREFGKTRYGFKMDLNEMAEKNKELDKNFYNVQDRLKDFEKTGSGEVLGNACTIYKDKKGYIYYMYEDKAMLKIEFDDGSIEATEFETNVSYDDSYFEPPKDIDYDKFRNLDKEKLKELITE
jgi:hypothetical protein